MPATPKRNLSDADAVGLKFVKSFGPSKYEGTVTACGAGPDGTTQPCQVVYEDGDDEVMPVAEVLNWQRKRLASTSSSQPAKRPKAAALTPKIAVKPAAAVPKSSAKKASRGAASRLASLEAMSSWTAPTAYHASRTQSGTTLPALLLSAGEDYFLAGIANDLNAAKPAATAAAAKTAAAAAAAAAASLQLTVVSAAAGEAVATVAVPLLVDACGLASSAGGFGVCWWAGLALNVTGSGLSGAASVAEQAQTPGQRRCSPRAAAAAASLRGGFLGAYTSFAGMALQAGDFTSSSGGGWAAGAAFVAGSLALGAAAFAFGRSAARRHLPVFTNRATAKANHGPTAAPAAAAADAAPPPAVELLCLVAAWLCLLVADAGAPSLAVGMACAALAAFAGAATGASNSAANACATALALAARALLLLGPGAFGAPAASAEAATEAASAALAGGARAVVSALSGRALLLKFEGSFCGALSTFCGAAEDLADAADALQARLQVRLRARRVGGARGATAPGALLEEPSIRRFAASAAVAAVGAASGAHVSALAAKAAAHAAGSGLGVGAGVGLLAQLGWLLSLPTAAATLATVAATAALLCLGKA
jgi:hypothetical protein